ncbi:MAG: pantoate--beta-alanine ligase [Phycisphaeraceae bacterium]|nr:pantoate--beta-alanine ligase [Phycisphaeraceae bacterium]
MERALGGARGVFVPTMGALHEGHASLVRQAAAVRDAMAVGGVAAVGGKGFGGVGAGVRAPVVVSVFVNPTQFNDPRDLERYPKTPGEDAAMCERAGCDVLYMPSVGEVYPAGVGGAGAGELPAVATEPGLEDAHRPGHFAGVCGVVSRLFELVRPAAAVFGEKDWQQLKVIEAMTRARGLGVRIVPGPTVREADGLAMSSRNRFLSAEDRRRALGLVRALRSGQRAGSAREAERLMRAELEASGLEVEYAVVRDAARLTAPAPGRAMRALIAARCGSVRLIDNAAWPG